MTNGLIKLLDHGYVRLVDSMGSDLSIVRAARVSYDAEWRSGEDEGKDEKLIRYLMRNRHTSPFESVTVTFEVKAPIFVLRQWMRHRTWSFNEVSARYTELPEQFYVPRAESITAQATGNKQCRTDVMLPEARSLRAQIMNACKASFVVYRTLLEEGCPRELARGVLPMNTYSRMFATVDLHNLFHFLRLRLHSHSQFEIRVYAEGMLELVRGVAKVAVATFEETLKGEKE